MVRVALVKGDKRYRNIQRALSLIRRDINAKDIRGKRVLIKPNLVSDSKELAVTHVDAVRAVLDFIHQFNPSEIVIAEAAASGDTMEAYRSFGYTELENVKLVDVNRDRYEKITICTLNGEEKEVRISKTILNTEYRISVARAKTHDHVFCTLTLKNMMGSIPHLDHVWIHGAAEEPTSPIERAIKGNYILSKNLVRIAKKVKPNLGVVDGLIGMEGDGPVNGSPIKLSVAAASIDSVAVDAVMTSVMGFNPKRKGDIYLADEAGLGISDLNMIEVIGEKIQDVRVKFKPHSNYYETQLWWMKYHPNYKW